MKLAVDVMGYENDISEAILACREFVQKHSDVKIVLFGNKAKIIQNLVGPNEFEIVHTDEFISQEDTIFSARKKPNSSMQLAANYLKNKQVDGLLSAGSTPVFVVIMYTTIGLIDGVNQPGFMPTIPTINNDFTNMIDVGATLEPSAIDLIKFAIMANEFSKQTKHKPTIGILNVGTEEHKGKNELIKANELIKKTNLNYVGFVESKNILNHAADIIICDGYAGNIALKACEGSVKTIGYLIKNNLNKNLFIKFIAGKFLRKIFNRFNYKNYAGAFVLGLNEICVKTHGSADKQQFYSSLEMLYECIKNNVLDKIKLSIKKFNDENIID